MIVKELIEELQKLPQNSLVLVRGYENGHDKADSVAAMNVKKKLFPKNWEGEYEDKFDSDDEGGEIIPAVRIGSKRE